jgi:hypothetical protein
MPPSLSGPPGVLHPLFPHLGWGCSACPLVAWSNEECGPPFVPEERGESPGQEDGACKPSLALPSGHGLQTQSSMPDLGNLQMPLI